LLNGNIQLFLLRRKNSFVVKRKGLSIENNKLFLMNTIGPLGCEFLVKMSILRFRVSLGPFSERAEYQTDNKKIQKTAKIKK
jgi:hypothetical protein